MAGKYCLGTILPPLALMLPGMESKGKIRALGKQASSLPIHVHGAPVLKLVHVMELFVSDPVFMHHFRALHIKAAVLGDFHHSSLSPPADRVQSVPGFTDAERGRCENVKFEPVSEDFFNIHHQIECLCGVRQVQDCVGPQHFVVKIDDIKSDDEICFDQLIHQQVDVFFGVYPVFAQARGIGDTDGHSHFPLFIPPASIIGGPLRFQIEIDDIAGHEMLWLAGEAGGVPRLPLDAAADARELVFGGRFA